jgi:hypothetical protein
MAACCLAVAGAATARPLGVVELFTSQGCNSCPPADAAFGRLIEQGDVVALAYHIDYWDYLGWKDTLADPRHTARQKGYAYARGDGQVYTPQVVVNGNIHVLGSDRTAIEQAITKSRKHGAMTLQPVRLVLADGRINVDVPGSAEGRGAEVWLCGLMRTATVAIGRGENQGRTVTYHNVVRRWLKLGDWTGRANSWNVPLQALEQDGIDRAAVLVQSGTAEKPKMILGAALAGLR